MNAESVEQLISLLTDIASQTQENSSKLAALDRTLAQHEAVNAEYRESMGRLRFVPANRSTRQKTGEALDLLRQALLRDQPLFQVNTSVKSARVRPRRNGRTAKKKQLQSPTVAR
ncbi:MAG: hypothetical protein WAM71_10850 [Candidatus Korobacteraceae bacterium]